MTPKALKGLYVILEKHTLSFTHLVSGQYWSLSINKKHTYNNFSPVGVYQGEVFVAGCGYVVQVLLLHLQTFNTLEENSVYFVSVIQVSKKEWMLAATAIS